MGLWLLRGPLPIEHLWYHADVAGSVAEAVVPEQVPASSPPPIVLSTTSSPAASPVAQEKLPVTTYGMSPLPFAGSLIGAACFSEQPVEHVSAGIASCTGTQAGLHNPLARRYAENERVRGPGIAQSRVGGPGK